VHEYLLKVKPGLNEQSEAQRIDSLLAARQRLGILILVADEFV
jgi:hypothetical protein